MQVTAKLFALHSNAIKLTTSVFCFISPGAILECKGLCAIFQKTGKKRAKRAKIFENLGKNVQNLKTF